jgi:hypothetical protein
MVENQPKSDVDLLQDESRSWKHSAAISLLGEDRARALSYRYAGLQAWRDQTFTSAGRVNRDRIRRFRDKYVGRRCVIIGNGPSLRRTDLRSLRNEITFGLNRIYLMFDELGFETTFHVVVNQLVVQQCADDFRKINAPLFTTKPNKPYLQGASNTAFLMDLPGPKFFRDASHGIWVGGTVTYVAMQLAYYMGFTEVILVGVDHRFAVKGPPNEVIVSREPDASHFDPNYYGVGFKWQLPDLETSEIAYGLARREFETAGRRIVDATVDGALAVFPKVPLDAALSR